MLVISPNSLNSLQAILRKILRMIFPERVFGNAGVKWIKSGLSYWT
ncbi:MAG: hypothetical protein U0T83_10050 [Bacteriovoracaceae bacterium]